MRASPSDALSPAPSCPECGAEDRIALLSAPEGGLPALECVACGLHKVLDEVMGTAPDGQLPDNEADVVRWVEAK